MIATYLHGPLLPKNPQVCDYLLEKALQRKYGEEVKLEPLKDETEKKANSYIADRYSDKKYVLRETVKDIPDPAAESVTERQIFRQVEVLAGTLRLLL